MKSINLIFYLNPFLSIFSPRSDTSPFPSSFVRSLIVDTSEKAYLNCGQQIDTPDLQEFPSSSPLMLHENSFGWDQARLRKTMQISESIPDFEGVPFRALKHARK